MSVKVLQYLFEYKSVYEAWMDVELCKVYSSNYFINVFQHF